MNSRHSCILLSFVLALPCQGATLIGVSPNLPVGGTASDLAKIVIDERSDGVGLFYASAKWCDLEPRAGQYNLKTLDGFPHLSSLGFKIAFNKCLQYYRVPHSGFRAYLSSLGLKRANGTARKSWDVFRSKARAWAQSAH